MTDKNDNTLFELKYYKVVQLKEPLYLVGDDSVPPLCYSIVNKHTGLEEAKASFLPAAIETIQNLDARLTQHLTPPAEEDARGNILTLH